MIIKPMVVDLYHGDDVRDFAAAKAAGVIGIIHKATQGTAYRDPLHDARRKAATDAGLLWGSYHFNTGESAAAEVAAFLSAAQPDTNTLMALDFEANKGHVLTLQYARDFLSLLDAKIGRHAVLYSGNAIKEKLGNALDVTFSSRRLWLCQYGPTWKMGPLKSWQRPWLWQYTDGTAGPGPRSVPGIPGAGGKVDLNHYEGSADDLRTEWAS